MDIGGFLSYTFRSAGERILNWLSENGVEVRIEYHAGEVHYQRALNARNPENRAENREADQHGGFEGGRTLVRLGAAVGSAVIVGTAVAAAGIILAAPHLIGADVSGMSSGSYREDMIASRCTTIEYNGESQESCPVCLESFSKGEHLLLLPCLHKYHRQCIMPWLTQTGQCSVCRFNVGDAG